MLNENKNGLLENYVSNIHVTFNSWDVRTLKIKILKLKQKIIFTLKDEEIRHKSSVKFLEVHFDKNMTFGTHIRVTVKKATLVVNALRKLLPRVRGPIESKKRLLAAVAMPILCYAAPV